MAGLLDGDDVGVGAGDDAQDGGETIGQRALENVVGEELEHFGLGV